MVSRLLLAIVISFGLHLQKLLQLVVEARISADKVLI